MGETMRVRIWLIGLASIVAATAIAEAKTIKVFNPTHYAMVSLQAKKPAAKEWDADLLGKTALGVGKARDIDVGGNEQNCKVDLRITFDDGHKVEKKNVDACGNAVIQFGED